MKELKYELFPQNNKSIKPKAVGSFSILNDETVFMDQNDKVIGVLQRPKVIFITHIGIKISGFEQVGHTKSGEQKFSYVEWLLRFILEE